MKRVKVSAAVALMAASGLACVSLAQSAPADSKADTKAMAPVFDPAKPLPTDQRLVTGVLDNGLTYIVRKHDNPPTRAAIWLHVSTGSLNETDKQRGMAHYLEHMAFNGSENFKPGTVIDFFQSLGLNFGQHQNAFTSFDQTSYQLFLPDNTNDKIEKALTFMADVKGRLSLLPKEIEEERGIILEERRTRLGGRQRVQDFFLENLAPGSLIGQRLPIGIEDTIKGVQEQDFKDYYSKYYVPSNMTLMIVADRDEKEMVELIRKHFSFGTKVAKPADQDAKVKPYETTRAIIASDKEITDGSVGLVWIYPPEKPTTTVGAYRADLVEQIGTWAFNRRLQKAVADGKVAFLGGGASASDLFRAGYNASMNVRSEPEKWEQSLRDLAVELRRANLHGFTEQEVADARKELLAGAEQFLETEKTMPARGMLSLFNNAISNDEPIMSAAQELDLHKQLLPGITPAEVSKRFSELFNAEKPLTFSLQLPATAKVPTENELISLGKTALEVKPEAQGVAERPTALMSKLPEPGKILESKVHESSKVTTALLENNIPVNYRFMDYRKDQVSITIMLAAGELMETAENRGITTAAAIAWNRPATSTLTSTNIRDLMTGKKVNVGGAPRGEDAVALTVSGSPSDLETGLQLAHLLLTDPVIEKPAFEQLKQAIKLAIAQRTKDIQAYAIGEMLPKMLYPSSEARFMPLTVANVDAMTQEAAQKWLREKILTAPIEVSVVGDIEQGKAMELVQKYIGSLPKRSAKMSNTVMADLRKVNRPAGPLDKSETFATATDKAMVGGGFFGPNPENIRDSRLMQVASRILSSRAIQEIREKRQLAYSPGVGFRSNFAVPGYSTMTMVSSTDPTKVEGFRKAIFEMFDEFAKNGPSEEEMVTVRKQFANTWDEQMREPSYWSAQLSGLNYRWVTLDQIMAAPEEFQKFSAAEVKEVFNKYYKPEARFLMSVAPQAKAETKSDAKP